MLLDFSIRNFSVVARSLEVGGVTLPRLGKHVKLLIPAVFRRSLTVVMDSQKDRKSDIQSNQEVLCCPVTNWVVEVR